VYLVAAETNLTTTTTKYNKNPLSGGTAHHIRGSTANQQQSILFTTRDMPENEIYKRGLPPSKTKPPATFSPTSPDLTTLKQPTSDVVTNTTTCMDIENQKSNVPLNSVPSETYNIAVSIQYQNSIISASEINNKLNTINIPIALWVANCDDRATNYSYDEHSGRARYLQQNEINEAEEQDEIYIELEPWVVVGTSLYMHIFTDLQKVSSKCSITH
jgi:hypothetical protein